MNSAAVGPDASIRNIALSTKYNKAKFEFSRAVTTTDRRLLAYNLLDLPQRVQQTRVHFSRTSSTIMAGEGD